jgi:hypothetical protein
MTKSSGPFDRVSRVAVWHPRATGRLNTTSFVRGTAR